VVSSGTREPVKKLASVGGDPLLVDFPVTTTGAWRLLRDKEPPTLQRIYPRGEGGSVNRRRDLEFRLRDDVSGIAEIAARVDSLPVYPEYDLDRNTLLVRLDRRISPGRHLLRLRIRDGVGRWLRHEMAFRLSEL
jgi:hypothetical protein